MLSIFRIDTLQAFKAQLSLILILASSALLFSLSTTLHFRLRGSLLEFISAIISIIPISTVTRIATKDLVLRLQREDQELLSGLLNGILGNAAELCFAITAIVRGEPIIAQTALTGALISGCLMIFGSCLISGGVHRIDHQSYPITVARTNAQLLVVSLVSVSLPAAYRIWSQDGESSLLAISHATAIILLIEFASYLSFFYYTHCDLANFTPEFRPAFTAALWMQTMITVPEATGEHTVPEVAGGHRVPALSEHLRLRELRATAQETHGERPKYPPYLDLIMLALSLPAMVFASIYVLEALGAPISRLNLSKSFVGLFIIPAMTASVEHVTSTVRSSTEDLSWLIDVAFGSCIRIALFVFPLSVVVGWVIGIPTTIILDGFQVTILCLTVFLVNHIVHNEVVHWLEGSILISSYFVIAIAVWHYPNEA